MRQDGFHAKDPNKAPGMWDDLFTIGETVLHYEVTTRSGRHFRYNLSDYRFGPDLNPDQARALAQSIAAEKYKECDWDRGHPRVHAEAEIADELLKLIMQAVCWMQNDLNESCG